MKLSDYVMQFVAAQGVRHVFLLPGGGCMHLLDSLGRCRDLEFVCNLHEQACAIAAEAYGQYTNNLGVCLVTTGPGGTNTITGVTAAWLDSTPCLFISGQVKRSDMIGNRGVRQMGFQEIDIVRLVEPITKYAVTVMEPEAIRHHLEKAVYLARSGRPGPVWLDIPLDVQAAMIEPGNLKGFVEREGNLSLAQDGLAQQVRETIRLLNQAERPVILAGNGIRLAQAREEFLKFMEILKLPVLATWKLMDFFPESYPFYTGRPGSVGQRGANFTQQNADLIIAIGARLDFGQIGFNHANFAREAKKIMVDVDAAEIGKMMVPLDLAICADARGFLREFLRQALSLAATNRSSWLARCKQWQAKYPVVLPEYWQQQDYVNSYVLMATLAAEMTGEDLLVPGSSGACSELTMQAFQVKAGQRIFNSQGLGPMGFGIAASIGGCLAAGRRRTISVDGDGGFHMNTQELETVRRLHLPIKFFVLNNQGYGSIRATQRNYFQGFYVASSPDSGLTLPDTVKMAEAYGIPALRVENHNGLQEKVQQILNSEGPFICEVMTSPEQLTMPRVSSMQRADGTMVSKPLEDLWPFLDRGEFLANMMVPPLKE